MTDQEREIQRVISYIRSCRDAGIDTTITIDKNRNHFILNALEEIQQYRAIGAVEEIQEKIGKLQRWHDEHLEDITVDLAEYRDLCKLEEVEHMKTLKRIIQRNGTIGKALDECAEYEEIGTVDECRKAMEKQKAKKPILCMNERSGMFVDYADGHGEHKTQMNNWWRCPCCNSVVGQRVIVHKHIDDQRKKKFCEKCGQSISWERDSE